MKIEDLVERLQEEAQDDLDSLYWQASQKILSLLESSESMADAITLQFEAISEKDQRKADEAIFDSHEDYLIFREDF